MQLVGEIPSTRAAVAGVEIEHDAERDDLALAGGEPAERRFEVGREALDEALVDPLGRRGELLAPGAPALGAEVVERDGARDLAEPGAGGAALRVEAVPEPQRALERLAGQVLGRRPVAGEPGEVAVDVVEVPLGGLREGHPPVTTPPGGRRHTFVPDTGSDPGQTPRHGRPAPSRAPRRSRRVRSTPGTSR